MKLIAIMLSIAIGTQIGVYGDGALAGTNDIKLRFKQQQEQLRKKQSQEALKSVAPRLKPDGAEIKPTILEDGTRANAGKNDEAALLYRNLRLTQKLSDQEARAVLRKAGYPTEKIQSIP